MRAKKKRDEQGETGSWERWPLRVSGLARDARGDVFGARPAELTWEARFGLLKWAGMRGSFRVSWAVPRWADRATKQQYFGWDEKIWVGPVYQTHP
jgi:hypothetical protein